MGRRGGVYLQDCRGECPLCLFLLDLEVFQDYSREKVEQDHGDDDCEAAEEDCRQDWVAAPSLQSERLSGDVDQQRSAVV